MDTFTLAILMAIIGGFVTIANYVRVIKNDAGELGAALKKLETQVQHLEQQIVELKEDVKSTQKLMQVAVDDASKAKFIADALHDRLDGLDIKSAVKSRQ